MKELSIAVVWLLLVFGACTKYETPVLPSETAGSTGVSSLPLAGRTVVSLRNNIGSVRVVGGETDTSVNYVIEYQVTNPSGPVPQTQLSSIQMAYAYGVDTVGLFVNYPRNEPRYVYSARTTFLTPYRVPCVIDAAQGDAVVSDLGARVTIRNVNGAKLVRHNGSCNISSREGAVYAEVQLPANGSCVITALNGDITLKMPASTSANVTAQTSNGTVSHSGLSFVTMSQQQSSLSGRLGAGNGEIRIETRLGNISLQLWAQ